MITYHDLHKSPAEVFTGYEYGNETDIQEYESSLERTSSSYLMNSLNVDNIPDEVDFTWHRQENQMRQGSCQGHSLTSCLEGCYWIDSGGMTVNLSRNAGYRFSQVEDGITGDSGSTLSGGVRAAKKGICEEKYFPYTETYSRRIPQAAYDNRSKYKLVKSVPIAKDSPAMQVINWIGSGRGFCAIGMKWNSEMDSQSKISKYTGRGSGGGHAVSFLGYSLRDETLKLVNSWGFHWGSNGVKDVTFKAFNQIMRYGWNHGYLYSDIEDIEKVRSIPDFSIIGDVV
jgi:C1A family cysteine protease